MAVMDAEKAPLATCQQSIGRKTEKASLLIKKIIICKEYIYKRYIRLDGQRVEFHFYPVANTRYEELSFIR